MWFVLSLVAGLLFAANRLIARSILAKKTNALAFGAVHELLASLLLLPVGLFFFTLPQSGKTWLALVLMVLFIFLCDLFAFLSLRSIEASLYQIIGQLRHVVVLFGAYVMFTEVISLNKVASIVLIIFGVIVALAGKAKLKVTRGTVYALLSTAFIALAFLCVKVVSVDVSPVFAAALGLTVSGMLMYALFLRQSNRPATLVPTGHRAQLVAAAVIFAVFEAAMFSALALGEASKVTPVTQSSMIFTLIGGYLFLGEKEHLAQKIAGCGLIALGIGLLYLV